MEKRSPGGRCTGPACGNSCLEPSLSPSWFLPLTADPAPPGRDADSGSLLATALSVGPSAPACAKQLKNGIFVFASSSGDTLRRLEGCISSLFQTASRQAGSEGGGHQPP